MEKTVNHLDSVGYFNSGVPVNVLSMEHNGRVSLHDHQFFELVYIKNGFAMHTVGEKNMILTAGDLFLITPGQVHAYFGALNTRLYNCLFFPEQLGILDEISNLPGFRFLKDEKSDDKWQKLSLDINERQSVLHYLDKMLWEAENKPIGWNIKIEALLSELLVCCSRIYASRDSLRSENPYVHYVYRALEYIEKNFSGDFQIKDVAENIGISSDYLAKLFRQVIGISPIEYMKTYRISVAMERLKNPNESISSISSELGFRDISHFSRQFKQVTGKSPTSFKKEIN